MTQTHHRGPQPFFFFVLILGVTVSMAVATGEAWASRTAKSFVQSAASANQFEISAGRLALQNSQSDAVKEFAQHMVDDHTQTGDKLKATLASSDAEMPMPNPQIDDKHQKILDRLEKASPQDFDKEYVKSQVKAHDETVSLFQDYAKNGDNASLKDFASQTLPALKEHQKEAKDLKSSI